MSSGRVLQLKSTTCEYLTFGIRPTYSENLYPKLKDGADCFVMIADYNKYWCALILWQYGIGGYFEGDPLNPFGQSRYPGRLALMSVLHVVYLTCIKPYVSEDTIALEIGPGKQLIFESG